MTTYICWDEPLWDKEGNIYGNSVVRATQEDVILWRKGVDERNLGRTDEEVLDEFIVINWAWKEVL